MGPLAASKGRVLCDSWQQLTAGRGMRDLVAAVAHGPLPMSPAYVPLLQGRGSKTVLLVSGLHLLLRRGLCAPAGAGAWVGSRPFSMLEPEAHALMFLLWQLPSRWALRLHV